MMRKKIVFFVFVLTAVAVFTVQSLNAAEYGYVPKFGNNSLNAASDVETQTSEFEEGVEPPIVEYNTGENAKDPRTVNEKVRAKLHLPATRKIYYHNIDKSEQPITMEQYYKLSAEKKRADFEIPEPDFDDGSDMIMPEHQFKVIMYNTPPGKRNIDLTKVVSKRVASSPAILSPDKKKLVYTKSFFYPEYSQTSSVVYFLQVPLKLSDPYEILYTANVVQGGLSPLFSVGQEEFIRGRFITLFPLDWSKDGNKIALKEKIGSNYGNTYQTNIIVYDFEKKDWQRLNAVREAIIYYWRQNKNIDLKDYLWDIYPIGWDKNNPDRIMVYAYAFSNDKPLFLGTWSIDANNEKSLLVSLSPTDAKIELNGFGMKEALYEH